MIKSEKYDLIVNDINAALDKVGSLSNDHLDVINMIQELWADCEETFYDNLDIESPQ